MHCYISLLHGLLVVTWLQSGVMDFHANTPDKCCFTFYKGVIPTIKLDSYILTREDCSYAGVILITKKNLRMCVEPHAKWVQNAIKQIDEQKPHENTLDKMHKITNTLITTTSCSSQTMSDSKMSVHTEHNKIQATSNSPVYNKSKARDMVGHNRSKNTVNQKSFFCLCALSHCG